MRTIDSVESRGIDTDGRDADEWAALLTPHAVGGVLYADGQHVTYYDRDEMEADIVFDLEMDEWREFEEGR